MTPKPIALRLNENIDDYKVLMHGSPDGVRRASILGKPFVAELVAPLREGFIAKRKLTPKRTYSQRCYCRWLLGQTRAAAPALAIDVLVESQVESSGRFRVVRALAQNFP